MNKENFLKGILGGVIGSLVGVVAILFFYKLGYVAAVAGLLMSICTIGLYKKFAGGIGKQGVIICIVIMMIMTFIGVNLAFSVSVANVLKTLYNIDTDASYIFFNLFKLMNQGMIKTSSYVIDLLMIVVFNIMGSVGVLKKEFAKIKTSNTTNNVI